MTVMKKQKVSIYLSEDVNLLLEQECLRIGATKSAYVNDMIRTQLDFQRRVIEQITPQVFQELVDRLKATGLQESSKNDTDLE